MREQTERAEAGTRTSMNDTDHSYTGLAKHPLARRWMLKRLTEAREKASEADTEQAMDRWKLEADRVSGELRRCGVDVGGGK